MKHPTTDVVKYGTVYLENQPGFAATVGQDGCQLIFSGLAGKHIINSLVERLTEARDALGG